LAKFNFKSGVTSYKILSMSFFFSFLICVLCLFCRLDLTDAVRRNLGGTLGRVEFSTRSWRHIYWGIILISNIFVFFFSVYFCACMIKLSVKFWICFLVIANRLFVESGKSLGIIEICLNSWKFIRPVPIDMIHKN